MADGLLGKLYVEVTADTKNYDKKIISIGKDFDNVSKKASIAIGAIAVASTKFASDLNESVNAVSVVYGDSAKIIEEWGKTASTQAGLSQTAFNETATTMGTLLKKTGEPLDEVALKTIELTKRSSDLASVFNKDVSIATTALGAVLRGESEPARQFGINISAVAVEAKALELGLIDTKAELTEATKIQARYSLILEESAQVQGDFVNTSDESANSLRIIKADLENAGAELGQTFLPIFKDATTAIRGGIEDFNNLSESTKTTIIVMGGLVGGIYPAITAVNGLSKAFKLMASPAGGIGLALVAITAIVAGVNKINEANKKLNVKAFEDLAETSELTAEELLNINYEFANMVSNAQDLAGAEKKVQKQFNLTYEELVAILAVSEDLHADDQAYYKDINKRIVQSNEGRAKTVELKEKELDNTEEQTKADKKRYDRLIKGYIAQNNAVQEIIQSDKDEIELIQDQIDFISALALKEGTLKDDQLEAIAILEEAKKPAHNEIINQQAEASLLRQVNDKEELDAEQVLLDTQLANLETEKAAKQSQNDAEVQQILDYTDLALDQAQKLADG